MWGVDVAGGGVGRVVALGLIRQSLDDAGGGVRVVVSCCMCALWLVVGSCCMWGVDVAGGGVCVWCAFG